MVLKTTKINTLEVMNPSGHLTLKWDHEKPDEVENARIEVERLRQAGYSFFLVTGEPADAVSAAHGEIEVRRIDDPLMVHEEAAKDRVSAESIENAVPTTRRGRRPKRDTETLGETVEGARAVAVKPQRGG